MSTVSGLSELFLDCPDSFCIVRTVSGLGGQFLDCLDSFQIVWTVSGLCGPEVSDNFVFEFWYL